MTCFSHPGEDLLLYSNELKGPPITLLRFDKSLYLQWDINQSKLPYLDNYRLKISDYEGVKKPMYVNISANCINLLLYGQNTSQFDSIAVYELQICQDWECAYRRGERKPQNLVAINYSNPSEFVATYLHLYHLLCVLLFSYSLDRDKSYYLWR